jgi:hypothetical protein
MIGMSERATCMHIRDQMCTILKRAVSGSTRLNQWEYTTKHPYEPPKVHGFDALLNCFVTYL